MDALKRALLGQSVLPISSVELAYVTSAGRYVFSVRLDGDMKPMHRVPSMALRRRLSESLGGLPFVCVEAVREAHSVVFQLCFVHKRSLRRASRRACRGRPRSDTESEPETEPDALPAPKPGPMLPLEPPKPMPAPMPVDDTETESDSADSDELFIAM